MTGEGCYASVAIPRYSRAHLPDSWIGGTLGRRDDRPVL
jgi:hypothetical protein